MFIKQKVKKNYSLAVQAADEGNYRLAVPLFKKVIKYSLKSSKYYNFAFQSFVKLGDIYLEANRLTDSELLYQMAASIESNTYFILLHSELNHFEATDIKSKSQWLAINMIDKKDIIKSTNKKNWYYLTKKATYKPKKRKENTAFIPSKKNTPMKSIA